jgi:hypothetical protein
MPYVLAGLAVFAWLCYKRRFQWFTFGKGTLFIGPRDNRYIFPWQGEDTTITAIGAIVIGASVFLLLRWLL